MSWLAVSVSRGAKPDSRGVAHLRYACAARQPKDQDAVSAATTSALNGALSSRRVSR